MNADSPQIRACIERLPDDYEGALRRALDHIGVLSRLRPGDTAFIKPNLTFPVYRPGVMTSLPCVEALVRVLKDHGARITVGDADSGGYNRFDIDDVQRRTGLKDLEMRYGISVVNLSRLPRREIRTRAGSREIAFPLPALLTEEADRVFSVAVPKIHMNTLVSMTVKNLWGCIPEPRIRLRLHPFLPRVLSAIVGSLRETVGIIDGRFGLNRSGPMRGDPVRLDWLMACENLYAADRACCRLMRIEPERVYYLRPPYGPAAGCEPVFNCDWTPFVREAFHLKRAWTDYPGLFAFRSPFLSYVAYFSPLAGILHKLLYLFREPFYDYEKPDRTAE